MPHDHDELEVGGAHLNSWSNWSGSVRCRPAVVTAPWSLEGLKFEIEAARQYGQTLRMAGSGHSFTPLCQTDGRLVSLANYRGVERVDKRTCRVRVRGGTTLRELSAALADQGLALQNMGDIDTQAVAGALTTGTHGTGAALGTLATQITGLNLLQADGSQLWCSADEHPDLLRAARISLGALGIITEVELQCVPAYNLAYECRLAGLDETLERLGEYKQAYRNFEFYWFPHTDRVQLKFMNISDSPAASAGTWRHRARELLLENGALWLASEAARRFPGQCARLSRLMAHNLPAHSTVRAWHHSYATRRLVRFNESEYSIPGGALADVMRELRRMIVRDKVQVHFPVEARFVAADDIPLSPAHQRESAYVAVHMYRGMPYENYFRECEALFDAHAGRPHWGKMHNKTATDLESLYPEWAFFHGIRRKLDPQGLFTNSYLRGLFGEA